MLRGYSYRNGAARALVKLGLALPALSELAAPALGGTALGAATGALVAGEGNRTQGALLGGALGGTLGAGGKVLHSLSRPAATPSAAATAEEIANSMARSYRSPTEKDLAARLGEDIYEHNDVVRFNPDDTFEQYMARKAQRDAALAGTVPVPAEAPAAKEQMADLLSRIDAGLADKAHDFAL